MDHTYIDEQQVIDRYVRGTLPAEEAARFEEHYLYCQHCLDRLDLAESMKRGFQRAAGQDAARVVASRQLAFVAWLARLGRSRQAAALAMALLVAVLLPWGLAVRKIADRERELAQTRSALEQEGARDVGKLRAELEANQRDLARERARASAAEALAKVQGNVRILGLNVERGGPSDVPTSGVHLPSAPGWIVLSLGIDSPDQAAYQVVLRDVRGREVWRGDDLQVDGESLNLGLPSTLLAPGDYTLAVEGLTPGRKPVPAGRFVFRVLPPA
jgi:hypothetical protein